jgi:hypothetical protein
VGLLLALVVIVVILIIVRSRRRVRIGVPAPAPVADKPKLAPMEPFIYDNPAYQRIDPHSNNVLFFDSNDLSQHNPALLHGLSNLPQNNPILFLDMQRQHNPILSHQTNDQMHNHALLHDSGEQLPHQSLLYEPSGMPDSKPVIVLDVPKGSQGLSSLVLDPHGIEGNSSTDDVHQGNSGNRSEPHLIATISTNERPRSNTVLFLQSTMQSWESSTDAVCLDA